MRSSGSPHGIHAASTEEAGRHPRTSDQVLRHCFTARGTQSNEYTRRVY